jgi:hypothetical protein
MLAYLPAITTPGHLFWVGGRACGYAGWRGAGQHMDLLHATLALPLVRAAMPTLPQGGDPVHPQELRGVRHTGAAGRDGEATEKGTGERTGGSTHAGSEGAQHAAQEQALLCVVDGQDSREPDKDADGCDSGSRGEGEETD